MKTVNCRTKSCITYMLLQSQKACHPTTRWKSNGIKKIIAAIGKRICNVSLGRGSMSIESHDIEIWTRLVFDLGGTWLEVFNALDENDYDLHLVEPSGEFRKCT